MRKMKKLLLLLLLLPIFFSCRANKVTTETSNSIEKVDNVTTSLSSNQITTTNIDSISSFYRDYRRKIYQEREVSEDEIIEKFNEKGVLLDRITRNTKIKEKKWQEEKDSLLSENKLLKNKLDSVSSELASLQTNRINSNNSTETVQPIKTKNTWEILLQNFGKFCIGFVVAVLIVKNWNSIAKKIFIK